MSRSEGYYSTLVHELTQWSGAKHRLNRDFGKRFGYQVYAAESWGSTTSKGDPGKDFTAMRS